MLTRRQGRGEVGGKRGCRVWRLLIELPELSRFELQGLVIVLGGCVLCVSVCFVCSTQSCATGSLAHARTWQATAAAAHFPIATLHPPAYNPAYFADEKRQFGVWVELKRATQITPPAKAGWLVVESAEPSACFSTFTASAGGVSSGSSHSVLESSRQSPCCSCCLWSQWNGAGRQ